MRMRARALILALCLQSLACSWVRPEASAVAQGEYYASGNPAFDEFFIKLHRYQVELASAPDGARQARADFTKNLGLGSDAADDQIEIRVKEEAQKLASSGLRLKVELPSEPSDAAEQPSGDASVSIRSSKSPTGDGELFVRGVQTSTTQLLRIRNRMRFGHKELERLRVQGIELDGQIDTAFRLESPWKRDEVRENIADGQKIVTLMIARADEVEALSDKLLKVVAQAATTDDKLGSVVQAPAPPPEAPEASNEKAKSSKASKKPSQKPARPAAKPRPAAAPKPAAPAGDPGEAPPPPKPAPAEAAPKEFEP
jgi:hypothetical protein